MSKVYTIYHLPGRKVGCTCNPGRRFKEYRLQGYTGPIEILERLHCSVTEAGNREWEFADKFGYRRGWHYTLTYAGQGVKRRMKSGYVRVNPGKIRFNK